MPVRLEIDRGKIARATAARPDRKETGALPHIAPGLFDIQVNGCGGLDFTSASVTPEHVAQIARVMDPFGVARFCPTVTSERFEVLCNAMRAIATACDTCPEVARRIAGIHLEGPYISAEDGPRGAHPPAFCRPPDWDEFQRLQEAAGGRIRILTMAVEFDNAPDFIGQAIAGGTLVAIGHTAADGRQIRAAVDAGARLSTHLGNGAHSPIRRHPNYIWDQLAEDRLAASLIVDGHHLPAEVVKTFVRAKTPGRCILISDLAAPAGLPPGRFQGALCETEILPDGRLIIAGQEDFLAGAALPIGTGVANVMRFAGLGLREAIDMAAGNPARLLGIDPGGLEPGDPADLVLLQVEPRFEIVATLIGGEIVFGTV